jgi:peptide-N4-(N-acetyl-beta-glucosaminyl)asparagine amidase
MGDINKFERNAFDFPYTKDSFILYKNVAGQYKDKEILAYVNRLIPSKIKEEIIMIVSKENNNNNNYHNIQFLKPLLDWFKKDYMKWMGSNISKNVKCLNCNMALHFSIIKGDSWKLRMTELYECVNCKSKIVFPRYGEIKRIADSRIGRCSEWSMLFGAFLNSLYIKTRIVQDYLDHCWNEALIDGKWIHIDSTLVYPISLNNPHYYEKNWAKKYKYILAFCHNSVDDVTFSYTNEWQNVQERRDKYNKKENIMEFFKNFYTEI